MSKFLHHPEAWNRVYENVSTIPEYWNATVPSYLADKSIPQVAALFLGKASGSNSEYAYCFISVPRITSQALNRTLTQLGFTIRETGTDRQNYAS
ncbi:hypothetical protein MUP01_01120 [Candidatus Bathyarchaeota archaeon]|nr:hypothetical protein [Candidatus Bathyarchaeota archaeon]